MGDNDHQIMDERELRTVNELKRRRGRLDVRVYGGEGGLPSYDDSVFDSMDSSEAFEESAPLTMQKKAQLLHDRSVGARIPVPMGVRQKEQSAIPAYAGDPLPVASSTDVLRKPEEVNRFFSIKASAVPRLYPEGPPKEFTDFYSAFAHPRLLNRAFMADTIQRLQAVERGVQDAAGAIIYTGPPGVGRTASVVHASLYARETGWLVLTLPNMATVTKRTTLREAEWYEGEGSMFDTPVPAYESLKAVVAAHGDLLARLPQRRRHAYGPRYRGGRSAEEAVAFAKQSAMDAVVDDVRRTKVARKERQERLRELATTVDAAALENTGSASGRDEAMVWEDGANFKDEEDAELLAAYRKNQLWTDERVEEAVRAECGHLSADTMSDAQLDERSAALKHDRTSMKAVRERAEAGELEHTLLDVASAGLRDPGDASRVLFDLRMELGLVEEVPVMVAVDAVNCAYEPTPFAVDNVPTHPQRLTVARAARAWDGSGLREEMRLKNGVIVGSTCSHHGVKEHFAAEVPLRSFVREVPRLNAAEARAMIAGAADKGLFRSYLSDNHSEWIRVTCSGLPKLLLRDLASGVEQATPPASEHDQYVVNMKDLRRMEKVPWPPVHPALRKQHSDMTDLRHSHRLAQQISVATQVMARSHMNLWTTRVKASGKEVNDTVATILRAKTARDMMLRYGHTREFDDEKERLFGDRWSEFPSDISRPEREADRKAAFKRALADAREVTRRREALLARVARKEAGALAEIEAELARVRNMEQRTLGVLRAAAQAQADGEDVAGDHGELFVRAVERRGAADAARREELARVRAQQFPTTASEVEAGARREEMSGARATAEGTDENAGSAHGSDDDGYSVEDLPEAFERVVGRADMSRSARALRSEAARTATDWALERDPSSRPARAAALGVPMDSVDEASRLAEVVAKEAGDAKALVEDLQQGRVPAALAPTCSAADVAELAEAAVELDCESSELWEIDQAATRAEMFAAARREMKITAPVASTDELRADAVRLAEYRNRVDRFRTAMHKAGVPAPVATLATMRVAYANAAAVEEALIWALVGEKEAETESATAKEVSRLLAQFKTSAGGDMADVRARRYQDGRIRDPATEEQHTRYLDSLDPRDVERAQGVINDAEKLLDIKARALAGESPEQLAAEQLGWTPDSEAAKLMHREEEAGMQRADAPRKWSRREVALRGMAVEDRLREMEMDAAAKHGITSPLGHARSVASLGGQGHLEAAQKAVVGLGLDPADVLRATRAELRRRMAGGDAQERAAAAARQREREAEAMEEEGREAKDVASLETALERRPVFETMAGALDDPVSMLSTELLERTGEAEEAMVVARAHERRMRQLRAPTEEDKAAATKARDTAQQALAALSVVAEEEIMRLASWRQLGMPDGELTDAMVGDVAARRTWSEQRRVEGAKSDVLRSIDAAMRRTEDSTPMPRAHGLEHALDKQREAEGKDMVVIKMRKEMAKAIENAVATIRFNAIHAADTVESGYPLVPEDEEANAERKELLAGKDLKGHTPKEVFNLVKDSIANFADRNSAAPGDKADDVPPDSPIHTANGMPFTRFGEVGDRQADGSIKLVKNPFLEDDWFGEKQREMEVEMVDRHDEEGLKRLAAAHVADRARIADAYKQATRAELFRNPDIVEHWETGNQASLDEMRREAAEMVSFQVDRFSEPEVVLAGGLSTVNRLRQVVQGNDASFDSDLDSLSEQDSDYAFPDEAANPMSRHYKLSQYALAKDAKIRVPQSKLAKIKNKIIKEKIEEYDEFHKNGDHPQM